MLVVVQFYNVVAISIFSHGADRVPEFFHDFFVFFITARAARIFPAILFTESSSCGGDEIIKV